MYSAIRSIVLLITLILTTIIINVSSAAAQTRYEAAGVFPGDVITNNIEILLREGRRIGSTGVDITVGTIPFAGTLDAYRIAGPEDRDNATRINFRRADYAPAGESDGPFKRLPFPVDRSAAGTGAQIDLSQPISVVKTNRINFGSPVFFVLDAAGLNLRSNVVDTAVVEVIDAISGDVEYLRFYETGPDTGKFSAFVETRLDADKSETGILSTSPTSIISASYLDANGTGLRLETMVMVGPTEPRGHVFDSSTGAPIDGVKVTLINAKTGKPATVYGEDLSVRYPATITTGGTVRDSSGASYEMEPGGYSFPYVMPGRYRIVIEAPEGYIAPSMKTEDDLAAIVKEEDYRLGEGSFLGVFGIEEGAKLRIDIPLDRQVFGSVTRTASSDVVEVGDFFSYRVDIEALALEQMDIVDRLPDGVRFIPGTLRVDGQPVTPSVSEDGRTLTIKRFPVTAGQAIVLTYDAQVTVGAKTRDLQISATTISDPDALQASITGKHTLRLTAAFNLDDVVILGQVVPGPCGVFEEGHDLSNIRVLLETGDYVLTDERGRFSFRGIESRPHVVQVDQNTIPRHSRLISCERTTRTAGSAISRFVDVRPGMMARAEFHIEYDKAAIAADVSLQDALILESRSGDTVAYDQDWLDANEVGLEARILTPVDGTLPATDAIDLTYLRPAGTISRVMLNNSFVPTSRIGESYKTEDGLMVMETWTGLRLRDGRNRIVVRITEDGEQIAEMVSNVNSAIEPHQAELVASGSVLESDGQTTPIVRLRVLGRDGIPLRPGTNVQIATDQPYGFTRTDMRRSEAASARVPSQSTTAVVGDEGEIILTMAPILQTGTVPIRILSDRFDIEVPVRVTAKDRPWVLVGLAEGTLAEKSIRENMRRSGDIGNALDGRVSLFAEGIVKGEWLLTLRYDSAQDTGDDFSGIDPDQDYIVYGDRSVQGDAAESRFPLYLRLRKEGAEFLVGDFDTAIDTRLIDVNRRMTGVRAVFESDDYRIMAFAAKTSQRFVEDRIALDGTAGPYQLSRTDMIPRSETIRLIEVSSVDATREISEVTLAYGVDYIFGRDLSQIYLRRPVPAFSADLNRYVMVVEYETDEDVAGGLLSGIRAEVDVSERVRIGATVIRATRVDGEQIDVTIAGVDVTFQATETLAITAETVVATKRSTTATTRGQATEIGADFDDGTNAASIYIKRQDGSTDLSSNTDDVQIDSIGGNASIMLIDRSTVDESGNVDRKGLSVEADVFAARDRLIGENTYRGEFILRNISDDYTYAMGLDYDEVSDGETRTAILSAISNLTWKTPDGRIAYGIGGKYALDSVNTAPEDDLLLSIAFGATDNVKIGATFEGSRDRDTGNYSGLVSAGAEIASGESNSTRLSLSQAFGDSRNGLAAYIGYDGTRNISDELVLSYGFDAQQTLGQFDTPFTGSGVNPIIAESFAALRAGLRRTEATWSAGIETEYRFAESGDKGNIRVSADGEVGDFWTIGADALFATSTSAGDRTNDVKLRFSAAYRGDDRDPITLVQLEADSLSEGDRSAQKIYGSIYRSSYPSDDTMLNLRYAAKYVSFNSGAGANDDLINFAGIEWRYDLSEAFDIGLHGSAMHSRATQDLSTSYGISAGFTPFENGWLSVGYNFDGFRDYDFSENGYTEKGAFIQFRIKFDQNSIADAFR